MNDLLVLLCMSFSAQFIAGCAACLPGSNPRGLENERVIVGPSLLSKELLYPPAPDTRSIIRPIDFVSAPWIGVTERPYITVVDDRRIWRLDAVTRSVEPMGDFGSAGVAHGAACVDLDNDRQPEILFRGGGFGDVAILKRDGTTIWRRNGSPSRGNPAHWMTWADLGKNDDVEFYVAAEDGLWCITRNGETLWHVGQENRYWYVDISGDQDSPDRRVVSYFEPKDFSTPPRIEHRDGRGNLLMEVAPAVRIKHEFRAIKWPQGFRILARSASKVYVLDAQGFPVFEYRLPRELGEGHGIDGGLIQFASDEPAYLVVLLGTQSAWNRSILCLFTISGQLIYQEIVPRTKGIAVVRAPSLNPNGEVLLLGNQKGQVTMYQKKRDGLLP